MAGDSDIRKLRQEVRALADKGLRPGHAFPVPPRKAMAEARKASKKLSYPVPPYAGASLLELARWVRSEWAQLGRWRSLALPVIVITALLTWEREKALQEAWWVRMEQAALKRRAAEMYGAFGPRRRGKKLLRIIPLPGRK
jgi:hypothetical protein